MRGLKFDEFAPIRGDALSHPVWGAWIEIVRSIIDIVLGNVAPRVGCVD